MFVAVGGVSFFLGDKHALEALRIQEVTPTQIANAMQEDRFFAEYRERTLLVTGAVTSLSADKHGERVRFRTRSRFGALCDLRGRIRGVRPSARITVIAEGATAERQSAAVMLRNCRLP